MWSTNEQTVELIQPCLSFTVQFFFSMPLRGSELLSSKALTQIPQQIVFFPLYEPLLRQFETNIQL